MAIAFVLLGVFLFAACTNPGGDHSTAGKKKNASSKENEIIELTEQTFSEVKSDIQKNGGQNESFITDISNTNLSKYNLKKCPVTYLGEKNDSGLPEGKGAFYFSYDDHAGDLKGLELIYQGEMRNGKADGQGIMIFSPKDEASVKPSWKGVYKGTFSEGYFVEGGLDAYVFTPDTLKPLIHAQGILKKPNNNTASYTYRALYNLDDPEKESYAVERTTVGTEDGQYRFVPGSYQIGGQKLKYEQTVTFPSDPDSFIVQKLTLEKATDQPADSLYKGVQCLGTKELSSLSKGTFKFPEKESLINVYDCYNGVFYVKGNNPNLWVKIKIVDGKSLLNSRENMTQGPAEFVKPVAEHSDKEFKDFPPLFSADEK